MGLGNCFSDEKKLARVITEFDGSLGRPLKFTFSQIFIVCILI